MNLNKKIASLLTSVSFGALLLGGMGSRASAGVFTSPAGASASFTAAFATDYVELGSGTNITGNVTNNGQIFAGNTGTPVQWAVQIDPGATVGGAAINGAGGSITAQEAFVTPAGTAAVTGARDFAANVPRLINNGTLRALATVTATGSTGETARATARGVFQAPATALNGSSDPITGTIGSPQDSLTNNGDMIVVAKAKIDATNGGGPFPQGDNAAVAAVATGVSQVENGTGGGGTARAQFVNSSDGVLSVTASGEVVLYAGPGNGGFASAHATAIGLDQFAGHTSQAFATGTNDGSFTVTATGKVDTNNIAAVVSGHASVSAAGVRQEVSDTVNVAGVTFRNTGDLRVAAQIAEGDNQGVHDVRGRALAIGIDQGFAFADLEGAVSASADVENSGLLDVQALAHAAANFDHASAYAFAGGIGQEPDGTGINGTATALVNNASTGRIIVHGTAAAVAGTQAYAFAGAGGVLQRATGPGGASATFNNRGVVQASGNAVATADHYVAVAFGQGIGVQQSADGGTAAPSATVALNNFSTGSITVGVSAHAVASAYAVASAFAVGVGQAAHDAVASSATVNNDGIIKAVANAFASATATNNFYLGPDLGASARAIATGVFQHVDGVTGVASSARAVLVNSSTGLINANATAKAIGHVGNFFGSSAYAFAGAVSQGAFHSLNSLASVANLGSISATAQATAGAAKTTASGDINPTAGNDTNAIAGAQGVEQDVGASHSGASSAVAQLTNASTGIIAAAASAKAYATYASAFAFAGAKGVDQEAEDASSATASIINNGSIIANAKALAITTYFQVINIGNPDPFFVPVGTAVAVANATGIDQFAGNANVAVASVINHATIVATAAARASATYAAGGFANVTGIDQHAQNAGVGTATIVNTAKLIATARADATAYFIAGARAYAGGAFQGLFSLDNATANFTNTGRVTVHATANAKGTFNATAYATGEGLVVDAGNIGSALKLKTVNNGVIDVHAVANAKSNVNFNSAAYAQGHGIAVYSSSGIGSGSVIKNTGLINVEARAITGNGDGWAAASAIGIFDPTNGANNGHIINTGIVRVFASALDGSSIAIGVGVNGEGDSGAATDLTTVTNNSGTIWAGVSDDGGKTIHRGAAINLLAFQEIAGDFRSFSGAPNPVLVELKGEHGQGNIYGDIQLGDNTIEVTHGKTRFDGIINNPDGLGGRFSEEPGEEGLLHIFDRGKLILAQNAVDGPAIANVETFTNGPDGTIAYELTRDDSPGHYPVINAVNAHLGGTLTALYTPGIYKQSLFYDNVIDADNRDGTFAHVIDNSAILLTEAIYDGDNNVDLKVTRQAFDAVSGLTINQKSAASAIENVFGDLVPGSDFEKLVGQLFALSDVNYPKILDQLAGAEYAQQLQSMLWSLSAINGSITDRMDCSANFGGMSVPGRNGCFAPNQVQLWARITGAFNNNNGDVEAPGYEESQYGLFAGGDFSFGNNFYLGAAAGFFSNGMNFDPWGGRDGANIDYSGGQFALYGGFDDGKWYLRNIVSYGVYDGTSNRDIAILGAPFDPSGTPDGSALGYYGEIGTRFALQNIGLTPYLGVSATTASIDGFTEKDPHHTGAALKVSDSSGDSVASTLGVRASTRVGGFEPELTLAWRHEYLDTIQTVHTGFAAAPTGANFDVISSDPGADSAIVGLGATYHMTPSAEFMLKYSGLFADGYMSNDVTARWTAKF